MSDRTGKLLIGAAKVMAGILIILIASCTIAASHDPQWEWPRDLDHASRATGLNFAFYIVFSQRNKK